VKTLFRSIHKRKTENPKTLLEIDGERIMLHASIDKNKTKDNLSRTQSETESLGRDRSSGWAGYSSLNLGGENRSVPAKQGNDRSQGWQPMSLSYLSQGGVLQRKCTCGSSAGSTGICSECQGKEGAMLQTKLSIGASDDKYEREADRVADEVMRMPEPTIQPNIGSEQKGGIQRKAIANSITPLQRSSTAPNQTSEVPAIVHDVLRSPGQPLDQATSALMESRFGHDFSQVRVHTGGDADRSALDLNAHAYTVGNNIVFGAGQYAPRTHEGLRLIAHELTHTVQQDRDIRRTIIQRFPSCTSAQDTIISADHARARNMLSTAIAAVSSYDGSVQPKFLMHYQPTFMGLQVMHLQLGSM
jgi:hypothetical protein